MKILGATFASNWLIRYLAGVNIGTVGDGGVGVDGVDYQVGKVANHLE